MKLHRVSWIGAVVVALLSASVAFAQPDLHVPQEQKARQSLAGLGAEGLALFRGIDALQADAFRAGTRHPQIHRVPVQDSDHPAAEQVLGGGRQRQQQDQDRNPRVQSGFLERQGGAVHPTAQRAIPGQDRQGYELPDHFEWSPLRNRSISPPWLLGSPPTAPSRWPPESSRETGPWCLSKILTRSPGLPGSRRPWASR